MAPLKVLFFGGLFTHSKTASHYTFLASAHSVRVRTHVTDGESTVLPFLCFSRSNNFCFPSSNVTPFKFVQDFVILGAENSGLLSRYFYFGIYIYSTYIYVCTVYTAYMITFSSSHSKRVVSLHDDTLVTLCVPGRNTKQHFCVTASACSISTQQREVPTSWGGVVRMCPCVCLCVSVCVCVCPCVCVEVVCGGGRWG